MDLGRAEWNSVRRSYEDGFIVCSKQTLVQHVFNSALEDGNFDCNFLQAATSMFNKHHHILAPTMIMGAGGRMPAAAAEALWRLVTKRPVSQAMVAAMLYSDNSTFTPGGTSFGERYYSNSAGQGARSSSHKRTIPDSDEDESDDSAGVGPTLRPRRNGYASNGTYDKVREILRRPRGDVPTAMIMLGSRTRLPSRRRWPPTRTSRRHAR